MQQDFTQVRASVATGIFLFSLNSLYNHNRKYWVYVIVACLFHISSLLMIPLWLISPYKIKKQMWIGLLIISYIMALYKIDFIDLIGLIPIEHIQSKFEMYKSFQEFGDYSANIFSLLHLSRIILWGLLLWKSDLIFLKNRYVYLLLKIMALSLVALPLFSLNIAAALRIMEYYGIVEIILFPMLLYTIKPTFVSKVILVCFARWQFIAYIYIGTDKSINQMFSPTILIVIVLYKNKIANSVSYQIIKEQCNSNCKIFIYDNSPSHRFGFY